MDFSDPNGKELSKYLSTPVRSAFHQRKVDEKTSTKRQAKAKSTVNGK